MQKVELNIHRYQLAGRLSEKLDEMGKDLTSMIEEINDASSKLSKNSKEEDPVSSRSHDHVLHFPSYFKFLLS